MGDKKKGIGISIAAILVISVFATFAITPVSAQPTNWGFETGDLTGWTVVAGNVEVLQSANFAPNIAPPEGRFFALLSNGPGDQGVSTTQDRDFALGPENDTAILQRTFTTTRTMTLTFNLAFLTSEENTELRFDDIFEVTMDGAPIVQGSVDQALGPSSPFQDYGPYDGISYLVTSPGPGPTSGSNFFSGRTNFSTYTVTVDPGTHTIEFYVGDQGNHGIDSGILIDAVPAAPVPTLTPIGIIALAGLLSAVAAISIKTSIRKKRR